MGRYVLFQGHSESNDSTNKIKDSLVKTKVTIVHLQMKPRGLCSVYLTQNVPGMWDSSLLHSIGTFRSLSNFV